LKLRLVYQHCGIPVEIEIEGLALTPNMIPSVLGSILEKLVGGKLESWLDTIMAKTYGRMCDMPMPVDTPQPFPQPQSPLKRHSQHEL